jgi:hypothetical protein
VTVNGKTWTDLEEDWVKLPADVGPATVTVSF